MYKYIIERECQCTYTDKIGCNACNHTGYRFLKSTSNRKEFKSLLKHYKHFYGGSLKVRRKMN